MDATMRWMYNSGNAEKKKYTYDSIGKGNYGTSGNKPIATGSIETYAVNNIYDMTGNVSDWTIEADGYDNRVYRGGNFSVGDYTGPASDRVGFPPTFSVGSHGFRVALYM